MRLVSHSVGMRTLSFFIAKFFTGQMVRPGFADVDAVMACLHSAFQKPTPEAFCSPPAWRATRGHLAGDAWHAVP